MANYRDIVIDAEKVLIDAQEAVGKVIREANERRLPDDAEQTRQALFKVDHAVEILRTIKERPPGVIGIPNVVGRTSSSGSPDAE